MGTALKQVTRWVGVRKTATDLGVSSTHLYYVLDGKRKPSKELAQKLRRLGIKLPDMSGEVNYAI